MVIRSRDGSEGTASAMALTSRQYSRIILHQRPRKNKAQVVREKRGTAQQVTFYISSEVWIVRGYAVLARGNAAGVAGNTGVENSAETGKRSWSCWNDAICRVARRRILRSRTQAVDESRGQRSLTNPAKRSRLKISHRLLSSTGGDGGRRTAL